MAGRFTRRRGFRRSRGLWFPVDNAGDEVIATVADGGVHTFFDPLFSGDLDAPTGQGNIAGDFAGGVETGLLPLFTQPGYSIKRLVGVAICAVNESVPGGPGGAADYTQLVQQWKVHFGIVITQTDETGASLNFASYNPFISSSNQKRWLFERFWRLEGSGYTAESNAITFPSGSTVLESRFPNTNVKYKQLASSHIVDIRPKARVGYEERLWQVWTVQQTNFATALQHSISLTNRWRMFAVPIRNAKR